MAFFGPPPNIGLSEALHLIFSHYVSPWKSSSAITTDNSENSSELWMDGASFSRMCKEAPDLLKYIGRTDIDLIFSRTKPIGVRRLDFDHFLDTLLELAVRIFPDDDPIIALANFLAKFIFALFDQPPVDDGVIVIQEIIEELTMKQNS